MRAAERRRFSTSTILQCNRDRPQFADRQRLHALVGLHESAEHLRIEVAIGMRDKGPRDSEDARIAFQRTVSKLGQLAVEAARKIVANFANLLLYDVKIIDQPFGRGSDGAFLADRVGDGAIRFEQYPAVVP